MLSKKIAVLLAVTTFSISNVFAQAIVLNFSSFYDKAPCAAMSLTESDVAGIKVAVNLSKIKDPLNGLPTITDISGITVDKPAFTFEGLYQKYAYITAPSMSAQIGNKTFTMKYISMVSLDKITGYKANMRLDDNAGNACLLLLNPT